MKFNSAFYLFCLIFLYSCEFNYNDRKLKQKGYSEISILELRENRDKYDGDTICISGRIIIEYERTEFYNKEYPLWIRRFKPYTNYRKTDTLKNKYVTIIGLFKNGESGHLGNWNGQINEIYDIKSN